MTIPGSVVPVVFVALAAAMIAWNFSLGVRLSTMAGASRVFRVVSGLCAFLFLPALVISLLATSPAGARVLGPLVWLWPLVACGVLLQSVWALLRGRSRVLVALPLAVFNLMVAWIAMAHWLDASGRAMPPWAFTPSVAISSLAAAALGTTAFSWAAGALVPVLAPAAPARWRLTRASRTLLAAGCATFCVLTGIESSRAYGRITSVPSGDVQPNSARTRGDLAVGVRVFGTLAGTPSAALARHDAALADSMGVTALHIEFTADGASATALDSAARSIESRRDSLVLVVTLDLGAGGSRARDDEAMRVRLAAITQIVRHLRPDILLPAERIAAGDGANDVAGWQRYYERAAAAARGVDRNVTIALATDASAAIDSALTDWVMAGSSPVDAVALSVRDDGARPARFTRALDAMARWASLASVAPTVWIVGVPTAPAITGELIQQRLVRYALNWGAAHSWVRGIIAGDASDGLTATGLRSSSGQSRRALADVGAALRAQRDLPAALPAADTTRGADTLRATEALKTADPSPRGATKRRISDTLTPPPQ